MQLVLAMIWLKNRSLDVRQQPLFDLRPSWSWSYSSPRRRSVLNTTLCDKVCQWLATCLWYFTGTPDSSTQTTDRHDITEILLKVVLNTITNQPHW